MFNDNFAHLISRNPNNKNNVLSEFNAAFTAERLETQAISVVQAL